MATGDPVQELCEELACPICLEHFEDPVMLTECGHNFCRACLTQSWGASGAEAPCPVCKQTVQPGSLRPNRQLANVVEIAKKLSLQERNGGAAKKEEAKERICAKHREPLKLFCQTDGILICTVCDRSKEHKHHEVVPAEEASQEYKVKIFSCLETLRTKKEKILVYLADAEDESREMLKVTESERQKTAAEFRTLRQLLTEQENHLLAQIDEVEKEIARNRDAHLAKLSEELPSLESLIWEMEEKHQQPVSELLQDVRSTLQRCEEMENFKNPKAFPSELKRRLQGCCDIGPFLAGVIKQFKEYRLFIKTPPQEQKQMLGEQLFPLIQAMHPTLAGKITGMLLEIDNSELLHMLKSPKSLRWKVDEAVAVLQAHQAKEAAQEAVNNQAGAPSIYYDPRLHTVTSPKKFHQRKNPKHGKIITY